MADAAKVDVLQSTCKGASGRAEPDQTQNLLGLAKELFEADKLGECLVILEAAKAGGLPQKQLERQKLVVQMHASAQRKDWWKVLQVVKGADEPAVRASYKRLAQQVEPLTYQIEVFLAEMIASKSADDDMHDDKGGFVKEDGPTQEEHAWWEKWDLDPPSAKRKRKREQDMPPQDAEETLNLRLCPIEDLRKEVTRRQSSVLRPQKGSADEKLTAIQRQQRVRAARSILNERLLYAENAPKKNGGFL